MKKNLMISIKLTIVMIVVCAIIYPLLIAAAGTLSSGSGRGVVVKVNDRIVGYELIGQKFTEDKYFWGRPSAVDYNAAGSAGSNKGPSNPEYLQIVKNRIDTFLVHNPGVTKQDIPAEMVTASASGLDPDISPAAAYVQVKRIARIRNLNEEQIKALVTEHIRRPLAGIAGPSTINVLKLNIALDALNK
jgi:potassium-transporting ATPase KdpC subunit